MVIFVAIMSFVGIFTLGIASLFMQLSAFWAFVLYYVGASAPMVALAIYRWLLGNSSSPAQERLKIKRLEY